MRIKITQETIFGTVTKWFDNHADAMKWIEISLANRVPCFVETSQ
jgi:hypothetical protein